MANRVCQICEEEKPLNQFGNTKHNSSGKLYVCKICRAELSKEWRDKNPQRVKELNHRHYHKNES